MSSPTLQIAGVRIRLAGPLDWMSEIAVRYEPYLSGRPADLEVEVEPGDAPRGKEWPFPGVTSKGRTLILSRLDFFAEIDGRRGHAVLRDPRMALDSFLRVLLSERLADRGGFLVHATAIGGRLFPGVSDADKSTLARLAPPGSVLSDELVAVVRPHLHGTPFWGSYARGTNTDRRRLEAILFLDRHRAECVRAISAPDALARLLECVVCFRDDECRARWMLAEAARVVGSVSCFTLSYDARKTGYRELERRLRIHHNGTKTPRRKRRHHSRGA